jgi:hypothetical protein
MKTDFDLGRLGFFIKRQLLLNIKSLWIGISAIAGTLLVITLLVSYFNPTGIYGLTPLYLTVFMISGFIFSSMVFFEMNSSKTSYAFLTLPVSTAEKLVGSWIVSSPVFVVLFMGAIVILSFVSTIISGVSFTAFPLFDKGTYEAIGTYMLGQTIFLVGATAFNGNNFLKTLLSLFLIQLGIAIVAGLMYYIFFGTGGHYVSKEAQGAVGNFVKTVTPVFYWALAPYLLLITYFKLKERQV